MARDTLRSRIWLDLLIGVYYQDLYPLISCLPRFVTPQSTTDMLPLWQASEDGEHPYVHKLHAVTSAPQPSEIKDSSDTATASPASSFWFSSSRRQSRLHRVKSFDPEKALADIQSHRPLKPARNPPKFSIFDYFPFMLVFKWMWKKMSRGKESVLKGSTRDALGQKIRPVLGNSNVPLEITTYLSGYSACMCSFYISNNCRFIFT